MPGSKIEEEIPMMHLGLGSMIRLHTHVVGKIKMEEIFEERGSVLGKLTIIRYINVIIILLWGSFILYICHKEGLGELENEL